MTISKVKLPPTGGSKVTLKHLGWEIFALMLKKPYTHNMMDDGMVESLSMFVFTGEQYFKCEGFV